MMPADRALRDPIRWYVNGRPLAADEWICTQYVGRDRLYHYDFETAEIVLWEARLPKDVFRAIYSRVYDEWLHLIRTDPELTDDRRSNTIRKLGYPPVERLTGEYFFVLRDEIVGDDVDLLELIYMDPPEREPAHSYAVQRIVEVVETRDSVRVFGIAVLP